MRDCVVQSVTKLEHQNTLEFSFEHVHCVYSLFLKLHTVWFSVPKTVQKKKHYSKCRNLYPMRASYSIDSDNTAQLKRF